MAVVSASPPAEYAAALPQVDMFGWFNAIIIAVVAAVAVMALCPLKKLKWSSVFDDTNPGVWVYGRFLSASIFTVWVRFAVIHTFWTASWIYCDCWFLGSASVIMPAAKAVLSAMPSETRAVLSFNVVWAQLSMGPKFQLFPPTLLWFRWSL